MTGQTEIVSSTTDRRAKQSFATEGFARVAALRLHTEGRTRVGHTAGPSGKLGMPEIEGATI